MGLGEITKQFAKEAIESQVKDVLSIPETPAAEKPGVPAAPEPVGATIIRQVQAMQAALKENEELAVLFHNGQETLRVLDVFQASPQVIVLAGFDAEKNITRVVSPAESLQLTCKVIKTQASAKPVRIRFITPKS
jgi:hypothetical protein